MPNTRHLLQQVVKLTLKHKDISRIGGITGDSIYFEFDDMDQLTGSTNLVISLNSYFRELGFSLSLRPPIATVPKANELEEEGWSCDVISKFQEGLQCVGEGEFDQAREKFSECHKIDPMFWRADNALANCDIYERRFDKAKSRLDTAITSRKYVPKALGFYWHAYGWAIFREGGGYKNPDALYKANDYYLKSLANLPSALDTRRNLCLNLLALGEIQQAEEQFRVGLKYAGFIDEVLAALDLFGDEEIQKIKKSQWISDTVQKARKKKEQDKNGKGG